MHQQVRYTARVLSCLLLFSDNSDTKKEGQIMEQESQKTDQQATNAALAALAAAGNSFARGQLWEGNKGLLLRLCCQWYD